jgi:hypothetical protein
LLFPKRMAPCFEIFAACPQSSGDCRNVPALSPKGFMGCLEKYAEGLQRFTRCPERSGACLETFADCLERFAGCLKKYTEGLNGFRESPDASGVLSDTSGEPRKAASREGAS